MVFSPSAGTEWERTGPACVKNEEGLPSGEDLTFHKRIVESAELGMKSFKNNMQFTLLPVLLYEDSSYRRKFSSCDLPSLLHVWGEFLWTLTPLPSGYLQLSH